MMMRHGRSLDSGSSSSFPWTHGLKSMLTSNERQFSKLETKQQVAVPAPALTKHVSWAGSTKGTVAMVPTKRTQTPSAPLGKPAVSASLSSPPYCGDVVYRSPEAPAATKPRLPDAATSTTTKPMEAGNLCPTPFRVLKTLQCVAPITGSRKKEDTFERATLYDQMSIDCCGSREDSSSGTSSIATAATLNTRTPWTARLTEDTLQRHETLVQTESPSRKIPSMPHFEGDKLAKIVIRQKTQYELAKEERKRAKASGSKVHSILAEEDGHVETVLVLGKDDATSGGDRHKKWLEEERQSKGQPRQNEHQERIHHEDHLRWSELERRRQLRAAELFRQRKLRAAELLHRNQSIPQNNYATPVASMLPSRAHEKRRSVSFLVTNPHRSTGTLIDI